MKYGQWIEINYPEYKFFGCSICRKISFFKTNYCSNCGAAMAERWRTLHDAEAKFPDNNVEVLLFANGCVIPGYYAGFNGSHYVWKSSREHYTFLDDEVTHWMPLPRSPKEDERWRTIV